MVEVLRFLTLPGRGLDRHVNHNIFSISAEANKGQNKLFKKRPFTRSASMVERCDRQDIKEPMYSGPACPDYRPAPLQQATPGSPGLKTLHRHKNMLGINRGGRGRHVDDWEEVFGHGGY
jgi:hypothetical protein